MVQLNLNKLINENNVNGGREIIDSVTDELNRNIEKSQGAFKAEQLKQYAPEAYKKINQK